MSIESLSQLEAKIQSAIETIGIYRLEIEELRELKTKLEQENIKLEQDNTSLRNELQSWSDKVGALLGRLDSVQEEETV
ncbi:cell division protein ZapB [Sansalvadorimonas sp. 2012CJ34-2]|uniref:Cell division protein ZapB n=1 Tax=Parendozoicomonas callyspongiae TaxID=2942213 RepID=A0ABT0PKD4_9GAMM|nr:cell division protein ZapB [Sansalvadorimonas sp. 2012CJ34-2]MCL6271177.1 cell division protein ZapB [Sansalvadorimonas sp. 2012CJ34-2]